MYTGKDYLMKNLFTAKSPVIVGCIIDEIINRGAKILDTKFFKQYIEPDHIIT